ncbi:MAG TPA: c-type cytochrome [Polyangia bacterium]|nr:c-type cytochrome [Polyangia bacterium]
MRSTMAMLLLLSGTEALAADREARARAVFTERCASCHTVGQGAPLPPMKHKVDLTLVARDPAFQAARDRRSDGKRAAQTTTTATAAPQVDPLREFIKQPWKIKPDTRCGANNLDEVQVELLVAFLKHRAQPPAEPPRVPPAQFQPPRLDEKQQLPTGPGDHR